MAALQGVPMHAPNPIMGVARQFAQGLHYQHPIYNLEGQQPANVPVDVAPHPFRAPGAGGVPGPMSAPSNDLASALRAFLAQRNPVERVAGGLGGAPAQGPLQQAFDVLREQRLQGLADQYGRDNAAHAGPLHDIYEKRVEGLARRVGRNHSPMADLLSAAGGGGGRMSVL